MKKPVNVFLTKYLTTISDLFQIGALCKDDNLDLGRIDKRFVWLEFKEIKSEEYPEQQSVWDNGNYISEKFLPFLLKYKERTLSKEDKKEFSDVYEYLDDDKVEDLIELIETAKNLNWL